MGRSGGDGGCASAVLRLRPLPALNVVAVVIAAVISIAACWPKQQHRDGPVGGGLVVHNVPGPSHVDVLAYTGERVLLSP